MLELLIRAQENHHEEVGSLHLHSGPRGALRHHGLNVVQTKTTDNTGRPSAGSTPSTTVKDSAKGP